MALIYFDLVYLITVVLLIDEFLFDITYVVDQFNENLNMRKIFR